jgi:hypothetical protein
MFFSAEIGKDEEKVFQQNEITFLPGDFANFQNIEATSVKTRFDRLGIDHGVSEVTGENGEIAGVTVSQEAWNDFFQNAKDTREGDAHSIMDFLNSYVRNLADFGLLQNYLGKLAAGEALSPALESAISKQLVKAIGKLDRISVLLPAVSEAAKRLGEDSRAAFDYSYTVEKKDPETGEVVKDQQGHVVREVVTESKLNTLAGGFKRFADQLHSILGHIQTIKERQQVNLPGEVGTLVTSFTDMEEESQNIVHLLTKAA